jgi:hypothetical protein
LRSIASMNGSGCSLVRMSAELRTSARNGHTEHPASVSLSTHQPSWRSMTSPRLQRPVSFTICTVLESRSIVSVWLFLEESSQSRGATSCRGGSAGRAPDDIAQVDAHAVGRLVAADLVEQAVALHLHLHQDRIVLAGRVALRRGTAARQQRCGRREGRDGRWRNLRGTNMVMADCGLPKGWPVRR